VSEEKIVVTGNTVIDALQQMAGHSSGKSGVSMQEFQHLRILLVTSHRRESWGRQLTNICLALKDLVAMFPDVAILYPVHLNPNVQETVRSILGDVERTHLLPPLDYLGFLDLMKHAYMILSDSGGVTEEAPAMGKPLLLLRKVTERPEGCIAGVSRIVGTGRCTIVKEASRLLNNPKAYRRMATQRNPYGDGQAAGRIVEAMDNWFQKKTPLLRPEQQFDCLLERVA